MRSLNLLLSPRWLLRQVFFTAWLFVIYVSVTDAFLLLQSQEVIADMERNPVGLALIQLADGVWLFFLLKLVGTLVASTLMLLLFWATPRRATTVASILAGLQFTLLMFLYFG